MGLVARLNRKPNSASKASLSVSRVLAVLLCSSGSVASVVGLGSVVGCCCCAVAAAVL